jgi:hypothetical protein
LEVTKVLKASYRESSVKYTAVLSKECLDDLKTLAERKVIPSVSQGIRIAVEEFVAVQKRQAYEVSLMEAAADAAFIKRTIDTQNDFAAVDAEGEEAW